MTEKLNNISEILNSIQKNLKSPKDQKNNHGNYAYRKAEDILQAYKKEIEKEEYPKDMTLKHRLSVELIGGRFFLKCVSVLKHNNLEEEAEGFAEIGDSQKGMTPAQLTGAVTSYAKKYALGNLFAIDDSKDDPDADEKPKGEKTGEPKKNAFGLSSDGPLASGDDMKETLQKSNEDSVARLIAAVKKKNSIAELNVWLGNKAVQKEMNRLEKYLKQGFDSVMIAIEEFKFQNQDIDDSEQLNEIAK